MVVVLLLMLDNEVLFRAVTVSFLANHLVNLLSFYYIRDFKAKRHTLKLQMKKLAYREYCFVLGNIYMLCSTRTNCQGEESVLLFASTSF